MEMFCIPLFLVILGGLFINGIVAHNARRKHQAAAINEYIHQKEQE